MSRKTTKANVPKDIMDELRTRFPSMSDSQRIRIAYDTSLMKVESMLRSPKVQNSIMDILNGKKTKKK